ncbi:serine hydrolase [Zavarzinia compransoris]|uniref:Serine hydrolase n=1 Tax=Zavarzinia compransoris TaxID=1264899 RepID=A0A317EAA9_9PROT|nr:serine hydrolase [Zavarzinia compransoris]PWR22243.1 serine hydrolase [Zavarzinia compransoris]TDP46999.1 beta-lactamase class A [Zavarzinia compransoris]
MVLHPLLVRALAVMGVFMVSLGAAMAQSPAADAALRRLFEEERANDALFTADFLQQVPAAAVARLIADLRAGYGPFAAVEWTEGRGTIVLERGRVPVQITLDDGGRIAGLFFGPPQAVGAGLDDLAARLRSAAVGDLSILVVVDGETRLAEAAARPMAVGSAFKLVVLRAYEDAVAAGALARDGVVGLEAGDRSLPSGVLHLLPPGTPFTLESLAGLMIRISDNTATDALIRIVGRAALERLSPRNRPFLTTGELFRLAAAAADREAYGRGDEAARRAVLAALAAQPLPEAGTIGQRITWPEAEWFLSAEDICTLLGGLRAAPALRHTSEPFLAALGWPSLLYKGGSEPGVLNLSALGRSPAGRRVCAVITANGHGRQPDDTLAGLFADLLRVAGE